MRWTCLRVYTIHRHAHVRVRARARPPSFYQMQQRFYFPTNEKKIARVPPRYFIIVQRTPRARSSRNFRNFNSPARGKYTFLSGVQNFN